jgi:hypothetical protein
MISNVEKTYYDLLLNGVTDSVSYRVFGFESKFDDNQRVVLYKHKTMTRLFCFDREGRLFTPSLYERMTYFVEETRWRDDRLYEILT